MYSNITVVAQDATTSFPTGTVLMSPFQTYSALDPAILEYLHILHKWLMKNLK
jgi:hypothetical protein